MHRPSRFVLVLTTTILLGATTQASWYNPFSWFKKDPPHTIIVTGNFVKSRVLAELIQYHTELPILFLPASSSDDKLYMLHYNGESMGIGSDRFTEFIYTLRPKTVLFLGNERYAPQSYIDQLGNDVTVTVFRNDNWERIAQSVASLLDLPKLPKQYKKQMEHFDDRNNLIKEKGVEGVRRRFGPSDTPQPEADPGE